MAEKNVRGQSAERPQWPKRAVVTAGMPYGNKALHFGHVGGVFVPADCYARFLKDRIGADNVLFISGTDCFGSPINEGYRKEVEAGQFEGTLSDYVRRNHDRQKATLDAFDVELSVFEGSGLDLCGEKHQEFTTQFITRLYENGFLQKRESLQFYDPERETFLNGRQVLGHCPVQGCKSEKAYADECDLGHQFAPEELINPVSTLSGKAPELRPVANWYFDLPAFKDQISEYVDECEARGDRPIVAQTIREFLGAPIIFVNTRDDAYERYLALADKLPAHQYREPSKGKQSFELEFATIDDRDVARDILMAEGIRIRTGKTLVPFRITGNIEWGVKAPDLDGQTEGLTVWCWPESLWAPISFTQAACSYAGKDDESYRAFWEDPEAQVYQFIGQDNLYFYGVAQPALWIAAQNHDDSAENPRPGVLCQSKLIANYHLLFGNTKASSSGAVKPPSADELLNYYTAEQLRAHFLALALDQKSVGFKPKPFDPDESVRTNPRVADPVLKEGSLLTKVFNRLARSCLYEAKNHFDCTMPLGPVSPELVSQVQKVMAKYEQTMAKVELHSIMTIMDDFIRKANKYWSDGAKRVANEDPDVDRRRLLVDSFYLLRVATLLMHPVVPRGCKKICDYLQFSPERFFSWEGEFASLEELCTPEEVAAGSHVVKELPPRTDFFEAHPSQFKK
ncbi:MAG: class I tRNA ligase family protein [Eggerthellales bacterium]|nr:class I tRNA ligase family protein [Eggerthellales bacterium]